MNTRRRLIAAALLGAPALLRAQPPGAPGGGYAEQRVDKPYHNAYDAAADRWQELPQLPRGANHVGVATLGERIYAFGGFIEQNRTPHDESFAFDGERWNRIRRLPEACGAMAC